MSADRDGARSGRSEGSRTGKSWSEWKRTAEAHSAAGSCLHDYFGEEMEEERCGRCDNAGVDSAELATRPVRGAEPEPDTTIADTEVSFGVGDRVSLPEYGVGQIEAIENGSTAGEIPGGASRKFKREFASGSTVRIRRGSAPQPETDAARPGRCEASRRSSRTLPRSKDP